MPEHAVTLAEILGPRPAELLARYEQDRVVATVREVQDAMAQTRDLGRGRSIG